VDDLSRRGTGLEQLGADGDEAVEEVGVQCLERGRVRPQCAGETALGDQEIDEESIQSVSAACADLLSLSRVGPASTQASTWWR